MDFKRLVRFEDAEGVVNYGDVGDNTGANGWEGADVEILEGDIDAGFKRTGRPARIKKVVESGVVVAEWWTDRQLSFSAHCLKYTCSFA